MKARELMIGDWVYCKPHKKNGRVYRLDEANGNGNGWIAVIDGDFYEDRIEPIMLTEEILQKNGWKWDGGYAYYDVDETSYFSWYKHEGILRKFYVHRGSGEKELIFHSAPGIRHVHTFQQSLRLCGFDKEIIL